MSAQPEGSGTVLVVDDTPANIAVLLEYLDHQRLTVLVARDGESALDQARYAQPDLILLDVLMPGLDGYETAQRLKADVETSQIPIIFITALSEIGEKVRGFAVGAVDYITKPFQQDEVLARVTAHLGLRRLQRALQVANERLEQRVAARTAELQRALAEVERLKDRLQAENSYLQEEIKLGHNFGEIIGQGPAMMKVLHNVEQVAATDANVLILGETGTGKELIARAVHDLSQRKGRALVKVNCAALPANLIESELFGHEKGAFTGAVLRRVGRFELADGGTIFLDEIGDLPLELQAKLLRILQEGELERLGNPHTIKVDVRVLAATNLDLAEAVATGAFREDLYYRLNVFPIPLPPLRQRREDIAPLVHHFVAKYAKKLGKPAPSVPARTMERLRGYAWPGNIRELENVIERALILSPGQTLLIDDTLDTRAAAPLKSTCLTFQEAERNHVCAVLEETAWQIEGPGGAAQRLEINPSTLRSRMRKLGIERPRTTGRGQA
jgi:formate hydrogenlyase transcriptional activator